MAWNWGGANGSLGSWLGHMDKILNAHKEMNKRHNGQCQGVCK